MRENAWKLVVVILFVCLAGALGQCDFGSKVKSEDQDNGILVEDFYSVSTLIQNPVTIEYLEVGNVPASYDLDDVLYLHIGPGTINSGDIRLTPYGNKSAGTKVAAGDNDLGNDLESFFTPYPRLVYVDWGDFPDQYDLNDSVYVKTAPPLKQIAIGDVRLTRVGDNLPGSKVRRFDPDSSEFVELLHPGPNFALWPPGALGKIRFYNVNGDLFGDPFSVPIYDAPDRVYFDISYPSLPTRLFGYVTANSLRLNGANCSVGDYVWIDLNENGIQDETEEGLANVEVELHDEGGRLITTCLTDSEGYYLFSCLCPGNYCICLNFSALVFENHHIKPTIPNVGDDDSIDSDGVLGACPRDGSSESAGRFGPMSRPGFVD